MERPPEELSWIGDFSPYPKFVLNHDNARNCYDFDQIGNDGKNLY